MLFLLDLLKVAGLSMIPATCITATKMFMTASCERVMSVNQSRDCIRKAKETGVYNMTPDESVEEWEETVLKILNSSVMKNKHGDTYLPSYAVRTFNRVAANDSISSSIPEESIVLTPDVEIGKIHSPLNEDGTFKDFPYGKRVVWEVRRRKTGDEGRFVFENMNRGR